ncbi:MAG: hypothetical protein COB01_04105 [Lutibacter sp.]|nr:MAG: hypothetical protein COB01_04105 [Lutibacter sp.]
MLKQLIALFFCLLLVLSCSYFEKYSTKEPIQEVDTIIDFNSVDAFPLFPNCKDIPSREKQQICFQLEIAQYIYAALKEYQLNANGIVNDTVLVKLTINTLGQTSLSNIKISAKTSALFPNFDSIVKVSLQKLPKLQPAIKRNIPVSIAFTLPIVLKN